MIGGPLREGCLTKMLEDGRSKAKILGGVESESSDYNWKKLSFDILENMLLKILGK